MRTRIGKRTRDQAALICAIAASNRETCPTSYDAAKALGYNTRARVPWLARRAIAYTNLWQQKSNPRDTYANAEALLRTGWSP